ncbi:hypothetical protein BKA69DRAFT_1048941 [Paraphysoderma sedebokerense]|nr:hypothetical protein BKA69DRAFT_1048941 [Paraphysoderma sedebokerense]
MINLCAITCTVVEVNNFANKGSVNGPLQGGGGLRAVIPNPSNPSKLRVGPAFLQWISWLAYGDYWVLEAGKYPESFKGKGDQTQSSNRVYDWAIVSGGAPKFDSNGKCRTGTGTNGSGLWIFTRDPIVSPEVVDYIRGIIEQKGFDLSVLKPVTQAGCKYEGFGQ